MTAHKDRIHPEELQVALQRLVEEEPLTPFESLLDGSPPTPEELRLRSELSPEERALGEALFTPLPPRRRWAGAGWGRIPNRLGRALTAIGQRCSTFCSVRNLGLACGGLVPALFLVLTRPPPYTLISACQSRPMMGSADPAPEQSADPVQTLGRGMTLDIVLKQLSAPTATAVQVHASRGGHLQRLAVKPVPVHGGLRLRQRIEQVLPDASPGRVDLIFTVARPGWLPNNETLIRFGLQHPQLSWLLRFQSHTASLNLVDKP